MYNILWQIVSKNSIFQTNINICYSLKLEIALTIPAEWKIEKHSRIVNLENKYFCLPGFE